MKKLMILAVALAATACGSSDGKSDLHSTGTIEPSLVCRSDDGRYDAGYKVYGYGDNGFDKIEVATLSVAGEVIVAALVERYQLEGFPAIYVYRDSVRTDEGYRVKVNVDGKKAVIERLNFQGAEIVAKLACQKAG